MAITVQSSDLALASEIDRVRKLDIDQLRTFWRTTLGSAAPVALSKDLLARCLAWHIQEQVLGGLDPPTLRLLARLANGEASSHAVRRLANGTVLVREHGGVRHSVTVTPEGFVWGETTYASLSTIARAITGTSWNGPRFFGLRDARQVRRGAQKERAEGEGRGRAVRGSVRRKPQASRSGDRP